MQIRNRAMALIIIDAGLVNLALLAALWLRFDASIPGQYIEVCKSLAPFFTVIYLVCFYKRKEHAGLFGNTGGYQRDHEASVV